MSNVPKLNMDSIPFRYDYYLDHVDTIAPILRELLNTNNTEHTTLDLCPGWSPKIAMALMRTKYAGQYQAVDISSSALKVLSELLNKLPLDFSSMLTEADILTAALPSANLIILNHILDDLIIYQWLKQTNKSKQGLYEDIIQLRQLWAEIEKNYIHLLPELAQSLSHRLSLAIKPQGHILIIQYAGYQEQLYGLIQATRLSQKLMKLVTANLLINPSFKEQTIQIDLPHNNGKHFEPSPYFTDKDCVLLKYDIA